MMTAALGGFRSEGNFVIVTKLAFGTTLSLWHNRSVSVSNTFFSTEVNGFHNRDELLTQFICQYAVQFELMMYMMLMRATSCVALLNKNDNLDKNYIGMGHFKLGFNLGLIIYYFLNE